MEVLNYKTYGDKSNESLIIVHGLFGTLDNWMTLSRKWSEYFHIIALDVRNHGKSFHSDVMTFEAICQDIINVMEIENIDKSHILGHSMGGKIVMNMIEHYNHKILKPIIVDVAPYAYSPHHNVVFEMIDKVDFSKCENRNDVNDEISNYLHNASLISFMGKNVKRTENLKFDWKFNAKVLKDNYEYLITYIPQKGTEDEILFIGGENSDYISPDTSLNMLILYPDYKLEFIQNAGHWVHADNPIAFSEIVMKFLNNHT